MTVALEELIRVRDARPHLGNRSVPTIYRDTLKGVIAKHTGKRVKLWTIRIGGHLFTTVAACRKFIEEQNGGDRHSLDQPEPPSTSPTGRAATDAALEAEQDRVNRSLGL